MDIRHIRFVYCVYGVEVSFWRSPAGFFSDGATICSILYANARTKVTDKAIVSHMLSKIAHAIRKESVPLRACSF